MPLVTLLLPLPARKRKSLGLPDAARGARASLTDLDDAAEFVQEQLVVPARVQPLFYVAVQFIHDSLHVRILVLGMRKRKTRKRV